MIVTNCLLFLEYLRSNIDCVALWYFWDVFFTNQLGVIVLTKLFSYKSWYTFHQSTHYVKLYTCICTCIEYKTCKNNHNKSKWHKKTYADCKYTTFVSKNLRNLHLLASFLFQPKDWLNIFDHINCHLTKVYVFLVNWYEHKQWF